MFNHRDPRFSVLLLILLALVLIWRGLVPAWKNYDTDFPNYYTSARLIREGADLSRIYDDAWFQQQMDRYGFRQTGKFSPFPPPTALVLVPLAGLEPLTSFRVLTAVNVLALLGCILVFRSVTKWHFAQSGVVILLAGLGVMNCLRFGQFYILVSLCVLTSYDCYTRGKVTLAGLLAGLFLPIKYFPLVMIVWFMYEREWRSTVAALGAAAIVIVASLFVMGWDIHGQWLGSVLPQHLASHYTMQSPYATAFQSWDSLLMRLFVKDSLANPYVLWDFPALYTILKRTILVSGGGLVLWAALQLRIVTASKDRALLVALLGAGSLLFAPGTATYHFVLLWLPMAILMQTSSDQRLSRLHQAAILAYALIGWIPYSWLHSFEMWGGAWNFFAYPRLLLLTCFFAILLISTTRLGRHISPLAEVR